MPPSEYRTALGRTALEALGPEHWTYVAARVAGHKVPEAAALAGISDRTGFRWEKEVWFGPASDHERKKLLGDKLAQLLPRIDPALKRLDAEISGQHGDDLAHASAVYVLDHVWGKAQTNVKQEVTGDAAATASTIVEVLRALADARRQALDGPQSEAVEATPLLEDSAPAESATFAPNPSD